MRSKGVFWGVLLISLGVLFALRNFGFFYFGWFEIRRLWPVILVVLGISLLPVRSIVRIILAFIIVVIAIIFLSGTSGFRDDDHWFGHGERSWSDRSNYDWNDEEETDQILIEEYNSDIENAVLELDAAAGKFDMGITDEYLLKFERHGNFGSYYLNADHAGNAVVLSLSMKGKTTHFSGFKNKAEILLNPDPVWDINMDAGAADVHFDLSPLKIDRIDIDGGASSVWIKLGDKMDMTDLQIDTGASSITIEVPRESGCRIETNTVLSSRSLEGFDKIEHGLYQTPGFEEKETQIHISVDAAVSSLSVKRY